MDRWVVSYRHRSPAPGDRQACTPETTGGLTTGCSQAAPRSGRGMSAPSALFRTASRNDLPEDTEGCARWHQRADGRASSTGPRRSAAACWGHCFLWVTVVGAQLLATGHGKAVRTAAGPARADLGCTGCAAHLLRPGSPSPPERTHAGGGLGVSRDDAARRENSWASRPKTRYPSKKHLGRRRFAPAQPGSEYSRFVGRRDGNAADTRPRAGEVFRGESTVAPCPLKTVQWVIGHTKHLPGRRGVLGVALG